MTRTDPAATGLHDSLKSAGFRGVLHPGEPLARHTTWRIGGPAELLAQPADGEDLILAIRWAAGQGVPWRILGNGSNLLVRDVGVRGLVLKIRRVLDSVRIEGVRIHAGAGASLPSVANLAASRGLEGLEFGAGIPGTIGGAVVMNAGWHQFEIGNVVEAVNLLDRDGKIREISREDCRFGYRNSAFREGRGVVLGCVLALRQGVPADVKSRLESFASSRKQNQPTELPSCGSVFLKPEGDFAGRLIEAAGLKGFKVGDAQVSPKHANFFINLGRATSAHVLELTEKVEREVESRFGVRLVREFEVW